LLVGFVGKQEVEFQDMEVRNATPESVSVK
jgi:hypothetical protein